MMNKHPGVPNDTSARRYGFDAAGKLPAQPSVQAQDLVGIFSNRASNPVIQAAAKDATEAILWEVCGKALAALPASRYREGVTQWWWWVWVRGTEMGVRCAPPASLGAAARGALLAATSG